MKKKSKVLLGIIIVLLAILAVAALFYFVIFDRFVLVSDPAWSYLLPSSELFSLRLTLAQKGLRLVVVNPPASSLDDSSSFTPMLLSLASSKNVAVLLGPLASYCAVQFDVEVSVLLENSVVYGIFSQSCTNFDVTLVSDVNAGWTEAAEAVLATEVGTGFSQESSQSSKGKTMAQKLAVVHDSDGISAYGAIVEVISQDSVLDYCDDGQDHLFVSTCVSNMQQQQVVLALCPHLENLYDLVVLDESVSWIVDYRYASIVPKQQLFGYVLPDLSGTLGQADFNKKDSGPASSVITLKYKYVGK